MQRWFGFLIGFFSPFLLGFTILESLNKPISPSVYSLSYVAILVVSLATGFLYESRWQPNNKLRLDAQLQKLAKMRDDGLITEKENQTKHQRIIKEEP